MCLGAQPSLCLLGPWEVGSRYLCHTVILKPVTSLPVVSSLLDVLPIYLCAPPCGQSCWMCSPIVSVLPPVVLGWMCSPIVSMPHYHHSFLSPSSQVCSCLRSTLMGAGETDLVHLTLRPSHPPPAHLHLDLVSSWAGDQVLLSAPLWPCPLPGCTRPQRVVGRQPRLRTGQLTHTGHGAGSLLPTVHASQGE